MLWILFRVNYSRQICFDKKKKKLNQWLVYEVRLVGTCACVPHRYTRCILCAAQMHSSTCTLMNVQIVISCEASFSCINIFRQFCSVARIWLCSYYSQCWWVMLIYHGPFLSVTFYSSAFLSCLFGTTQFWQINKCIDRKLSPSIVICIILAPTRRATGLKEKNVTLLFFIFFLSLSLSQHLRP